MAKRGATYRVTDYLARCLPKRGVGEFRSLFVHDVAEFLKFIDDLQGKNPGIQSTIAAGDYMMVFHDGAPVFWVLPGIAHMRMGLPTRYEGKAAAQLRKLAQREQEKGNIFSDTLHYPQVKQYRLREAELAVLRDFLSALPVPKTLVSAIAKHPRAFPQSALQAAWAAFEASGYECPGFNRRPHKLNIKGGDRWHYDHIAPYAKGGSSTEGNCRVLCLACNLSKGAKA